MFACTCISQIYMISHCQAHLWDCKACTIIFLRGILLIEELVASRRFSSLFVFSAVKTKKTYVACPWKFVLKVDTVAILPFRWSVEQSEKVVEMLVRRLHRSLVTTKSSVIKDATTSQRINHSVLGNENGTTTWSMNSSKWTTFW